jgi:hypothetical protein
MIGSLARILFSTSALVLLGSFPEVDPAVADGGDSEEKVVFYEVPGDGQYELRYYRPGSGSTLIATIPEEPRNVFWYHDFDSFYFRSGNKIFRMEWKREEHPVEIVVLPDGMPADQDLWVDGDTDRLRIFDVLAQKHAAVVYEYSGNNEEWKVLSEKDTRDCEPGGKNPCEDELKKYLSGRKWSDTIDELSHEMLAWNHLGRLNVILRNGEKQKPFYFPSSSQSGVHIGVLLNSSERLESTAPVFWVNPALKTKREVYGESTAPHCSNRIGFMETGHWLLVASEEIGACGRVVDMASGEIVYRFPEGSTHAVWVPEPQ